MKSIVILVDSTEWSKLRRSYYINTQPKILSKRTRRKKKLWGVVVSLLCRRGDTQLEMLVQVRPRSV